MTVKPTNFRSADHSAGFSLLEVLIAFGLVGVIMMALLSMMDIMNANNKRLNLILVRNDVVNNIRTQSLLYSNVDNSALMTNTHGAGGIVPNVGAPNNLAHFDTLAKCLPSILDPALSGCSKSTIDEPGRGNLFYLADHNSLDINRAIAGEDVFYRTSGARCDPADAATPEKCPLFARVWAEPYCLNFANYCNKAMALTIRYSVGVRADYPGGSFLPTADGEVYLPLQKGIQVARLLDQNNNGLTANQHGIYPIQKFLEMPDQINSPQGLRLEVVIGNPTGLVSMTVQARSLVGTSARGLDENSIPTALEAQPWTDLPEPGGGAGSWTIALSGAQPGQIFNFGTMTTSSTITGLTNVSFAIGSKKSAANAPFYHWTVNPANPTLLIPPTFKSGFYQFRIVAYDSLGGHVESTNYITTRITPRPEIFLTNPLANPYTAERDCSPGHDLSIKMLVGDDEEVTAVNATIDGSPIAITPLSGNQGQVTIPFAMSQAAGNYSVVLTAKDFFSSKLLLGTPIPETKLDLGITTQEVVPSISAIKSNPDKIRLNTTGDLTVSYTTGTCCNQTPGINWTYPNVPAIPGVMLTGLASSASVCASDIANNRRTCQGQVTATGIKEGPATASTNVSSLFTFAAAPGPACRLASGTYDQNAYIQVVTIPGITFYTSESLWFDFSNLANETGLLKPLNRLAWIQADFDPDENVTVKVAKITDQLNPICTVSFTGGTGMLPVLKSCPLQGDYSGDYILLKESPNIQGEADAPAPTFRAKLVQGKTAHRVCNTQVSNLSAFPAAKEFPLTQPMWNSPYNALESPPGSGNTSAGQDAKNDAGYWTAGSAKRLRCYDNWSTYVDSLNDQDIKVIKEYKASLKIPNLVHNAFTFSYASFVFPNNVSPDFTSVDFNSPNAPTFFLVIPRGSPGALRWTYTGGSSDSATTPAQPWLDRTGELCTGAASLSQIKIFSSRMIGFVNATTAMKATNSMSSGSGEAFSYGFVCTYGRWNPNGKASTTWIH